MDVEYGVSLQTYVLSLGWIQFRQNRRYVTRIMTGWQKCNVKYVRRGYIINYLSWFVDKGGCKALVADKWSAVIGMSRNTVMSVYCWLKTSDRQPSVLFCLMISFCRRHVDNYWGRVLCSRPPSFPSTVVRYRCYTRVSFWLWVHSESYFRSCNSSLVGRQKLTGDRR